jgi:hypothetical protein
MSMVNPSQRNEKLPTRMVQFTQVVNFALQCPSRIVVIVAFVLDDLASDLTTVRSVYGHMDDGKRAAVIG